MENLIIKEKYSQQEYNVIIEKNKYIKISCIYKNAHYPKFTEILHKIGDFAEYDSYNLSYIDKIKSISNKTITFENKRRLKLEEFCWRNWDFNLEKVNKSNFEISMTI